MTDPIHAAAPTIDAEELDELLAVTRHFAAALPARLSSALDTGDHVAIDDCWSGLCEIGLDRCLLPERQGGIALPAPALTSLLEELATGDGGTALATLLSNIALHGLGDAAPDATTGERCVFVPAADVREDAPGRLSGAVPLAYDAAGARRLVVGTGAAGGGGLFVVDPEDRDLCPAPIADQLGLGGARAVALRLDEVAAQRIGDATTATALLHAGVAAIARGIARRAETMALAYAEERYQGGGPIIIHGAVRDMLARMAERRLAGDATGDGLAAALARRIAATDAAVATTTDAVQVFGGMGYMVETGVEKLMRDAKACQLYPVSNWLARDWLLELQR